MKDQLLSDPKKFYEFINSKRRINGYPSLMYYDKYESSNASKISNLLASSFEKSYSKDDFLPNNCPYLIDSFDIFLRILFSEEVLSALLQ